MNRAERRRLKREQEIKNVKDVVDKAIESLLIKFYMTMRENKISKERANRIIEETSKKL